jgi:hypothetical protein
MVHLEQQQLQIGVTGYMNQRHALHNKRLFSHAHVFNLQLSTVSLGLVRDRYPIVFAVHLPAATSTTTTCGIPGYDAPHTSSLTELRYAKEYIRL